MRIIEPIYREIGELLYQQRMKKGMTTVELACLLKKKGLQIQRTKITHIEKGDTRLMFHAIPYFAIALELNPEEIIEVLKKYTDFLRGRL